MLGCGEDPPGALELMDATESLQPGCVDQVLLGGLPGHAPRPALGDAKVSVDGIAGQVDARILRSGAGHPASMKGLLAEGIHLFNKGEYWEAHEVWEREWFPDRKGPDSGRGGVPSLQAPQPAGGRQQMAKRSGLPPGLSTRAQRRPAGAYGD